MQPWKPTPGPITIFSRGVLINIWMKRLFVAVKINPDEKLLEQYYRFRKWFKTDRITWVDKEFMHITLEFIGDTPEEKIPVIHETLEKVAESHTAFKASIKGAGVFGSTYKPRVLWFGVEDTWNKVSALAMNITGALEEKGWENDRQNYIPHLTIARIKYVRIKKKLSEKVAKMQQKHLQDFPVDAFYLIESELTQDGPKYHTLHSYSLNSKEALPVNVSGLPWWKALLRKIGL